MLVMSLLVTDSCTELVYDDLTFQNILWNFYRIKDRKKCLTLMDYPHFYAELPKLREKYGHGIGIVPAKNLSQADKFHVLTNRQELVYIMTDQVTLTFGNFWRSKNAIIFKGLSIFVVFLPLFLMSCQKSVGGSVAEASSRDSRHLSEAHTVGSVNGLWRPPGPFQELLEIVVICNQLSQRDTHRPGNV
jgi:hypothetical protein